MSDINQIMNSIPHRYPLLLVDRVIEKGDDWIKTLKNITINEPQFNGHFPEYPIMPGVLIIEAMAQSAGILCGERGDGKKMLFMGIDNAKFRKEVRPGDQMIMEISITNDRKSIIKFKGVATVDGKKVAEAEMMAALK